MPKCVLKKIAQVEPLGPLRDLVPDLLNEGTSSLGESMDWVFLEMSTFLNVVTLT